MFSKLPHSGSSAQEEERTQVGAVLSANCYAKQLVIVA